MSEPFKREKLHRDVAVIILNETKILKWPSTSFNTSLELFQHVRGFKSSDVKEMYMNLHGKERRPLRSLQIHPLKQRNIHCHPHINQLLQIQLVKFDTFQFRNFETQTIFKETFTSYPQSKLEVQQKSCIFVCLW